MLLGSVPKQPNETFKVGADFSARLESGETLAGHTATARNLITLADTTSDLLTQQTTDGPRALVRLRAQGTDGERHRVQMRVVTSLGNTYEAEIDVAISEIV